VYIHHPAGETSEKFRSKNPHEACQSHQVYPVFLENFHKLLIKAFPVGIFGVRDNNGNYIFFPGALDGVYPGDIADDDTDLTIDLRAIAGIHDRLKIGAAP
jgi:hypothetical protein